MPLPPPPQAAAAAGSVPGAAGSRAIIAAASRRLVIITDASKEVARLGKFKLPIEVDRFGLAATRGHIVAAAEKFGCPGPVVLRKAADGADFLTDGGHLILDGDFKALPDPDGFAAALNAIPGVIEHGLFIGMASAIIIADPAGIRVLGDLSV